MKARAQTAKRAEKQAGHEHGFPTCLQSDSDQEKRLWREIANRLDEFCQERCFKLSPSHPALIKDLVRMRKLWGDYYCPCQPEMTPETVCVCRAVKDGLVDLMGACFCQLIIRD